MAGGGCPDRPRAGQPGQPALRRMQAGDSNNGFMAAVGMPPQAKKG